MTACPSFGKTAFFILLFVVLTGCVSSEFDDLRGFSDRVKAKPASAITPIPAVKPYRSYAYNGEGLRDPFQKEEGAQLLNVIIEAEGPGPDLDREKEALEAYPLDTLRMVGTLSRNGESWGLVKARDGVIHRVKSGHYLGQNFGKIMAVEERRVALSEWVTTAAGRWVEREASLVLAE